MKKKVSLNNIIHKKLILSILLSIGFVGGIPLLVISAVKGNGFFLTLGIILVVVGFYGTPIAWVGYANTVSRRKVYELIKNDVLTVEQIAQTTGKSEQIAITDIYYLLNKGILTEYTFVDKKELIPINKKQEVEKGIKHIKCPNCGAEVVFGESNVYCEYCGAKLKYD